MSTVEKQQREEQVMLAPVRPIWLNPRPANMAMYLSVLRFTDIPFHAVWELRRV